MPASTAVVNGGRAIITNRIIGSGTEPKYIGIGTGTTAVALTDTVLGGEVESRATGTSSRTTTTSTNDTYQVVGTITATGSRTIGEVGLFDASSSGNLFVRGVLASTVSLASGDSITATVTVQVTSSVV
ncbi:MAG: hypothetical protein RL219_192 [Actinomycetota bacterium]|jgi:hypothetical protein